MMYQCQEEQLLWDFHLLFAIISSVKQKAGKAIWLRKAIWLSGGVTHQPNQAQLAQAMSYPLMN